MEYQQNQGGGAQGAPHWGYSGGWGSAPAPAPPRPTKRAHSDSDDDAFSESSSKDAQSPSDNTNDSCQLLTRKRRRGVIEKKRRDRINTSLSELKRLVPTAYEKQGSAKLEKAEILQLTVDHLKMLHAKGVDTFAYDPQRYAMDYHSIGFRECASEVARYLVSCEGLDIQDPLRLRLMSHLQCFAAQRELAAKSCSAPWGYGSGPQYPTAPLHPPATPLANPLPQTSSHEAPHVPHSYGEPSCIPRHDPPASSAPTSVSSALPSAAPPAPTGAYSAHYPPVPPHYPPPYQQPPAPTHHQYPQTSSKPYRPWGAELAY